MKNYKVLEYYRTVNDRPVIRSIKELERIWTEAGMLKASIKERLSTLTNTGNLTTGFTSWKLSSKDVEASWE